MTVCEQVTLDLEIFKAYQELAEVVRQVFNKGQTLQKAINNLDKVIYHAK